MEMANVIVKGFILVPISELEIIQAALARHLALTREEPGCIRFEVNQDDIEPVKFAVNEEAFEVHQNRSARSNWGKVTTKVERH